MNWREKIGLACHPNFILQFTFGLQFTFSCNSLVHEPGLSDDDVASYFFSDQPLDEHDSCVLYWIVCVFFYNAAHSSLAMPTKFFFLWKKTVQNFCMATFKNVETFITHCPPICSKFAMLLGSAKTKHTHIHNIYFFSLQIIMITFWKCKDSSKIFTPCKLQYYALYYNLERHFERIKRKENF